MKVNLINRVLTTVLIAVLMLALAGVALAQDPSPQSVIWRANLTYYTGNGITASAAGSAFTTQADFGVQDCYQIIDVTSSQTVTGKLQHSPDGTNWVTLYTFSQVSADAIAFTRTVIYGGYARYTVDISNTNPVTVALKCVAKDN